MSEGLGSPFPKGLPTKTGWLEVQVPKGRAERTSLTWWLAYACGAWPVGAFITVSYAFSFADLGHCTPFGWWKRFVVFWVLRQFIRLLFPSAGVQPAGGLSAKRINLIRLEIRVFNVSSSVLAGEKFPFNMLLMATSILYFVPFSSFFSCDWVAASLSSRSRYWTRQISGQIALIQHAAAKTTVKFQRWLTLYRKNEKMLELRISWVVGFRNRNREARSFSIRLRFQKAKFTEMHRVDVA